MNSSSILNECWNSIIVWFIILFTLNLFFHFSKWPIIEYVRMNNFRAVVIVIANLLYAQIVLCWEIILTHITSVTIYQKTGCFVKDLLIMVSRWVRILCDPEAYHWPDFSIRNQEIITKIYTGTSPTPIVEWHLNINGCTYDKQCWRNVWFVVDTGYSIVWYCDLDMCMS